MGLYWDNSFQILPGERVKSISHLIPISGNAPYHLSAPTAGCHCKASIKILRPTISARFPATTIYAMRFLCLTQIFTEHQIPVSSYEHLHWHIKFNICKIALSPSPNCYPYSLTETKKSFKTSHTLLGICCCHPVSVLQILPWDACHSVPFAPIPMVTVSIKVFITSQQDYSLSLWTGLAGFPCAPCPQSQLRTPAREIALKHDSDQTTPCCHPSFMASPGI